MSPAFPHAHQCPACGVLWFHDPSELQDPALHDRAHECPACGTYQAWVSDLHTAAMNMTWCAQGGMRR